MQQQYSCYCSYPSCMQNNNIFFNYTSNSIHLKEHKDYTKPIHPISFYTLTNIPTQNTTDFNQNYQHIINEKVEEQIQRINGHISNFLRQKYFQPHAQQFINNIHNKQLDCQSICNQIKTGDQQLIRHIISYEQSQKEMSLNDFIKLADIYKTQSKIEQQFSKIGQRLIDILEVGFDQPNMLLNLDRQYKELKQKQDSPQLQNQHNSQSIQYQQYEQNQQHFSPMKYSTINKTKHIYKPIKQPIGKLSQIQKPSLPINQINHRQQVKQINQTEIIIHKCQKSSLTLKYILQHFKNITAVHIFSSTFANQTSIIKLIKSYNIEIITFNCNHSFTYKIFHKISEEEYKRFKCLQLKWGFSMFFNQYHILRHFPCEKLQELQRHENIRLPLRKWNLMPNNQTLWLESDEHIQQFLTAERMLERITTLHLASYSKKAIHLKHIAETPYINGLTTLNLLKVSFTNANFAQMIKQNKNMKSILIHDCDFQQKINQHLYFLRNLPFLSNFALKTKTQSNDFLQPDVITSLINLQNLYIKAKFKIKNQRSDSSFLKEINKLSKLRCLDLYNCYPIYSDLFNYLHKDVKANLRLLNIGSTHVDSACLKQLIEMKNLQYLNMDTLYISGQDCLKMLQQQKRIYKQDSKIKYFSIEQQGQCRFTLEDIKSLGRYLPDLEYIDVSYCISLSGYNFIDFKNLKTIALNKELRRSIKTYNPNVDIYVF